MIRVFRGRSLWMMIFLIMIVSYFGMHVSGYFTLSGDESYNNRVYCFNVGRINERALEWAKTLDVDPVSLRYDMGIKGKKKYVELLDIYLVLYQRTGSLYEMDMYRQAAEELAQITHSRDYHDLPAIGIVQFQEDITSYLRAWYIMDLFGFDTDYYRDEIWKIIPRLEKNIYSNSANRKLVFLAYLDRFGYILPYTYLDIMRKTLLRAGKEISILSRNDIYIISHEVFALHYADEKNRLSGEDYKYIRTVLQYHVPRYIDKNHVDMVAEMVMMMNYLELDDLACFRRGIDFLLNNQNENGSFGNYEEYRDHYESLGIDLDIFAYLHTTMVALRALNDAIPFVD